MKFTELKKNLKTNTYNNLALLGNDDFLLNRSYELILASKSFEPNELNITAFGESIDGEEVVKACNTFPVFSEFKLVSVNLVGKADFTNQAAVLNYLKQPNPTTILVFGFGNNKQLAEPFLKLCELVDCNKLDERTIKLFLQNELSKFNKTMEDSALKLMCEYGLYNLTYLNSEMEKLVAYVGTRSTITTNDVQELVAKNLDYQVFDLTEALAKKQTERAMELLSDMKTKKENEKTLLPLIANHFRRLFLVGVSAGQSAAAMAKLLKVKEYAVTVSMQQSKLFSKRTLKQINDLCLELGFAVKNGDMLADYAISYLILQILNAN